MRFDRILPAATLAGLLSLVSGGVSAQEVAPRTPEALRIFVPVFSSGETKAVDVQTKVISMALYFEILKAFAGSGNAARGAWILYGQSELSDQSHRSAEASASFPSVFADIVFWGNVVELGEHLIVEPYLTRTAISRKRNIQPEFLNAAFDVGGKTIDLSLANSSAFFDLEPFLVSREVISRHADYEKGIPIYGSATAPEPDTFINDPVYFESITTEAALVRYHGNQRGWIRFPELSPEQLTMIDFGHGLINVLRGDWQSAEREFSTLVELPMLPNALRIDALIYLGIAREKLGEDGLPAFRQAWDLNAFNRDAAMFLMLGLVRDAYEEGTLSTEFSDVLEQSKKLFAQDDPWLRDLRHVADALG